MALINKVGLGVVPSGYKANKLYSAIPNTTDGDFEFTRASSATRVNSNGIIETVGNHVPRLNHDFDSDGNAQFEPYLLLEPQTTNTATKSIDFTNAGGGDVFVSSNNPTEGNITLTPNDAIAPDNTKTATRITATAKDAKHRVGYFSAIVVSDETNVLSVFAKKGNGADFLSLRADGYDSNYRANFDLSNGTIGQTRNVASPKMENFGNGWYRCSIHFKTTTDVDGAISLVMQNADDFDDFDAVGTEFIFLFGIQCESTTKDNFVFPTSYIPTTGSAVTKSQDVCGDAGNSDLFNDTEGVLFVEIAAFVDIQVGTKEITINDGTANNRISLRYNPVLNSISYLILIGGSTISGKSYIIPNIKEFSKVALKYKSGDIALWVGGVERQTDNATFTVSGLSNISFKRNGSTNVNLFEGKVKQLVYFDEALSDTELEQLTTL